MQIDLFIHYLDSFQSECLVVVFFTQINLLTHSFLQDFMVILPEILIINMDSRCGMHSL